MTDNISQAPDEREAIAALIVAGKNLRQHWLDTDAYKEMDSFQMIMRAKEMRRRDAETKRDFLDALKQAERGNNMPDSHETCRIGSCQRHKSCMYVPCRNLTNKAGEQPTIPQADRDAPIMRDPLMDPVDAQIWRTISWFAGVCSLADIAKFKELMAEKPIALNTRTTSLAAQDGGVEADDAAISHYCALFDEISARHGADSDRAKARMRWILADAALTQGKPDKEDDQPPAQDGLVEALGTIVFMMGNVNHDRPGGANDALIRGGMLMDCKAVAEAALSAIKGDKS